MTTLPDGVRQSEILNQLVLNRGTMEELGRVEVLWMYPPKHRVLGFVCKAGFLGRKKLAFKLSQVEAIGANGILTHSEPDETDADRVSQLESLVQSEVWSQAGHKLGKIIDCVFDLQTGVISDYLVVGDRWSSLTGSIYRLPPYKVLNLGRERVLVAETTLQDLATYREGIQDKLTQVSATLKDEYTDVTEELRSLAKRAQQTTGQFKSLAEQAREQAQLLAEQARDRAQAFNEQWLDNAQTLAEKARSTREALIERVQDATQDWGEPFHETQPPTVSDSQIDDLEETLNWEQAFEWSDDQPAAPPAPPQQTVQPPPPKPAATQPVSPVADSDGEDDFWVIGEDLTLKRRTAIAQDQEPFTIDADWNLEDDPWDITEPPTEATPIIAQGPHAAIADAPCATATAEDLPTGAEVASPPAPHTVVENTPHTATVSTEHLKNDEDEPWV